MPCRGIITAWGQKERERERKLYYYIQKLIWFDLLKSWKEDTLGQNTGQHKQCSAYNDFIVIIAWHLTNSVFRIKDVDLIKEVMWLIWLFTDLAKLMLRYDTHMRCDHMLQGNVNICRPSFIFNFITYDATGSYDSVWTFEFRLTFFKWFCRWLEINLNVISQEHKFLAHSGSLSNVFCFR